MTTASRELLKGAVFSLNPNVPRARVIVFQYNPATLKRLMVGGGGGHPSQPVTGASAETISVEIEIDATEDLESGTGNAKGVGIRPQLEILDELVVRPTSAAVEHNADPDAASTSETAPPMPARVLFIWGQRRVLPVRLISFAVAEEEFDATLNPTRATVLLDMQVLTYSNLSASNADFEQYLAYQQSLTANRPAMP